ncbi:MAG: choice-of-anchor Q domain-containing protein [Rhizomicrobium sp.]
MSILDLTMVRGLASSNTFPNNCGGAIYNASALTLTRCRLISTAASLLGGAIYNDGQNGDASLTTIDSSITDCSAQASGGAIFNAGYTGHATASLTNCTLDGNVATQYGGAIYNDGTVNGNAALTLTNCTISNNRSNAGVGGNINNDGMNPDSSGIATILLRNNIFKRSTAANTGVNLFNDGGTFTSQGHNLSDDPAGGDGSTAPGGYLNAAGDKRNTDPLLTGARDTNGGSTYCMPLSAGSPAINAGDDTYAPAHDQRYFLRNGVSDIGAYEFNGTLGPVSVVSRKMHSGLGPFDVTLPVTGPAGVEPRNIGSGHQLVVIFPTTVTFSSASVTAGNAVLGSVTGSGTSTATINLTSAPDQQLVTLTLFNANDGVTTNNIPLRIGLLLGDANGDGVVNSADATIARNASGQVANASNFRGDFNLDGAINSADATTARNNSGHSTPLGTTPEQIGKASDAPYQTEVPLPTPAQADEF